jgi:hypothetical protein
VTKAYVDTTILTNILLKSGDTHDVCLAALGRYEATQTPCYAIKEFSAGPLSYWIWCHNKLKMSESVPDTMAAINVLFATPGRNRAATALEALSEAMGHAVADTRFGKLVDKYGRSAAEHTAFADRHRYWIRRKINKAWAMRRSVSKPIQEIPCFEENAPGVDEKGLLGPKSWRCKPMPDCALAPALKADISALIKLRDAILVQPTKPENQRRLKALRDIIRTPKRPIDEISCRRLGDAIFAFFAPVDSVILTTNLKDHQPLAAALGKSVEAP